MSQRLLDNTKWLVWVLALHAGSIFVHAQTVARDPPSNPATVEAQAKFFQYRNFPTTEEFNQGHRLGSLRHFTERHERAKPSEGLFSAKVRWGDKKGGYGEHYWDLNHAGHSGDNGNDGYDSHDSPYHESGHSDPYDEPSENSPHYGTDEYDPEKSSYEESGRAKRAHPKVKLERKHQKQTDTYEEESKPVKQKRKSKEELQAAARESDEEYSEDTEEEEESEEVYEKPKRHKQRKHDESQHQSNQQQPKEKKQFVLVVSQKDDPEKQTNQPQYSTRQPEQTQYVPKRQPELQYAPQAQPEVKQYVPYESGAGVRQYHQPELSAVATVPRLFLEPSTGHVVDRATGQAYVLQPIVAPKNYS